jgi:hypothetical protein
MNNLERWTMPDHYFGETWPDYFSAGVGQSRDSDALERSNFRSMLKAIGGESETVIVVREGHWAVGWVEWIAIHESDTKALATASEIKDALADYPVINESDWGELEDEDAQQVWRDCFDDSERLDYIRRYRSQFEFRDFADLIGCVRGKWFAGYPGDLLA